MKPLANLIPDSPEFGHDLFLCSRCLRRIVEADVKPMLHLPREDRAGFLRVVADGNDVVEGLADEAVHVLRKRSLERNTRFFHNLDGLRMNARGRVGARRMDLQRWVKRFEKPLRHLATAGVAGTKDENLH